MVIAIAVMLVFAGVLGVSFAACGFRDPSDIAPEAPSPLPWER